MRIDDSTTREALDEISDRFRDRVTRLRRDFGLSQSDVARALGMSQPNWSKIERGEQDLTVRQALLLVRLLELDSLESLFGPTMVGEIMLR